MKLNEVIDTKEGVMLRLSHVNNPNVACKFTFSERNALSDALTLLLGDFEDLGTPTKDRPYRYYKEAYFFEGLEQLPIKVDLIVNKNGPKA